MNKSLGIMFLGAFVLSFRLLIHKPVTEIPVKHLL